MRENQQGPEGAENWHPEQEKISKPFKTNKGYLERHLEPPLPDSKMPETSAEEPNKYPESVRRALDADVKYVKEGNEVVELKNGWVMEYTYEALTRREISSYSQSLQYSESLKQDIKAGKFRRLTYLSISSPTENELDLMDDFELDDVLFTIRDEDFRKSIAKADGKVFCYMPPNSFLGIMVLLHEVGHTVINKKILNNPNSLEMLKTVAKKVVGRKIFNSQIVHRFLPAKLNEFAGKQVLKDERDAWAVAVSALRDTLDAFNVSKKDFKEAIHKTALSSYSEGIRKL